MSNIEKTREVLKSLCMPSAQQNDMCCYCLLALAGIGKDSDFSKAANEWHRRLCQELCVNEIP